MSHIRWDDKNVQEANTHGMNKRFKPDTVHTQTRQSFLPPVYPVNTYQNHSSLYHKPAQHLRNFSLPPINLSISSARSTTINLNIHALPSPAPLPVFNLPDHYAAYLEVAQNKRVSQSDPSRYVEKNVLHQYGVIPENIYLDVYAAAHAYANLLCEVDGLKQSTKDAKGAFDFNIGCAVFLNRADQTRKLMLVQSGIKSIVRFMENDIFTNEKIATAFQAKLSPNVQILESLINKNKFKKILHYLDFISPDYIKHMKSFADLHPELENFYPCSEQYLFHESEKFCAKNSMHMIEGTVEFKVSVNHEGNSLIVVHFEPQESCSAFCETFYAKGYYASALNRYSQQLSPPRARPVGESFPDRVKYYNKCITKYSQKMNEQMEELPYLEEQMNIISEQIKFCDEHMLDATNKKKYQAKLDTIIQKGYSEWMRLSLFPENLRKRVEHCQKNIDRAIDQREQANHRQ